MRVCQHQVQLLQVLVERQDLLAVDVPAAAGPLLVLQDHARRADALQLLHHMAGHLRVDVAVVDVHQQVLLRERAAAAAARS